MMPHDSTYYAFNVIGIIFILGGLGIIAFNVLAYQGKI